MDTFVWSFLLDQLQRHLILVYVCTALLTPKNTFTQPTIWIFVHVQLHTSVASTIWICVFCNTVQAKWTFRQPPPASFESWSSVARQKPKLTYMQHLNRYHCRRQSTTLNASPIIIWILVYSRLAQVVASWQATCKDQQNKWCPQ